MASRNTVVAVGGTGTHIAISFLRLAILSNLDIKDIPNIIVVDADTTPGEKPTLLEAATSLFDELTKGYPQNERPIFKHILPYRQGRNGQQVLDANTEFSAYLLGMPRDNAPVASRQILDALFTRPTDTSKDQGKASVECSEQQIKIQEGFFARPSVGATSIYDMVGRPGSELQNTLVGLMGRHGQYVSLAVVGSSTGGTGSGCAPAIAQWLQSLKDAIHTPHTGARIGLFITLPWFSPDNSVIDPTQASYGKAETQRVNAAAGVRLYSESQSLKNAGVYVADYNGIQTIRPDEGNAGQSEHPHPLPVIFASQLQNFFLTAEQHHGKGDHINGVVGEYTFMHKKRGDGGFTINASDAPLTAFTGPDNVRKDLRDWAEETQSMRIILQHIAEYVRLRYRVKNGQRRSRPESFQHLVHGFAEMRFGQAKAFEEDKELGLPFMRPKIEIQNARNELVHAIEARERQLASTISWLRDVVNNSRSYGRETLDLAAIYTEVNLKPEHSNSLKGIFDTASSGDSEAIIIATFEKIFGKQKPLEVTTRFNEYAKKADMQPDAAAVHILETVIREYIHSILKDGVTRRANDHRPSIAQAETPICLIPRVGVREAAVTDYLASIDIKQMLDKGKDREGVIRQIHETTHPFTITGLKSASIPSPWAAAHLQSWIAMHGNEAQKAHARQSLEAVLWGVFTKRFEATWLNLADTRLGATLQVSLAAELGSAQDHNAPDRLLVVVDRHSRDDVIAANHPLAGWFIAPWLLEEAQANGKAEWWLDNQYGLELPTVWAARLIAENTSAKPDDFLARQVSAFVQMLEQLFALHTVNAAEPVKIAWAHLVGEIKTQIAPAVHGIAPLPYRQDQNLAMTLRARNANTRKYELRSFGVAVLQQSLWELLRNYVPADLISVKSDKVDSRGQVTTSVRHPDVPIFAAHISRLRSCSGPIVEDTSVLDDDNGVPCTIYKLKYTVVIDGLGQTDIQCESKAMDLDTYVAVFPNFKTDGWGLYHVGCHPDKRTITTKDEYTFSLYDVRGSRLGEAGRTFRTNHEVQGVPEYLSLTSNPQMNSPVAEHGLYRIGLQENPSGEKSFHLGIDIGTSHSCFFPTDSNGQPILAVDFSSAGRRHTCVVFDHPERAKEVEELNLFLGPHSSANDVRTDKFVLPSVVKVQSRPGVHPSAQMIHAEDSSKHFSSVPYVYASPQAALRRGTPGEFLQDFKWSVYLTQTAHHGLKGTEFEKKQKEVLSVYIRQMLLVGLALLRVNGYSTLALLRVTYPESFSTRQLENYAETLSEVFNQVAKLTGISIQVKYASTKRDDNDEVTSNDAIEKEGLLHYQHTTDSVRNGHIVQPDTEASFCVSESLAAIAAYSQPDGQNGPLANVNNGLTLVLDMGGGTTDIALYASRRTQGSDTDEALESITDSIQYAGNDVLSMLNSDAVYELMSRAISNSETPQKFGASAEGATQRMALIKRLMRNPKSIEMLSAAIQKGKLGNLAVQINTFFAGLTNYATAMVKAYQGFFDTEGQKGNWDVQVILLGNGWKLTDLVYENNQGCAKEFVNSIRETIQNALGSDSKARIPQVVYNVNDSVSVKEAIAFGSLKIGNMNRRLSKLSETKVVAGTPLNVYIDNTRTQYKKDDLFHIGVPPADAYGKRDIRIEIDSDQFSLVNERALRHYATLNKEPSVNLTTLKETLSGNIENDIEKRLLRNEHDINRQVKISPHGIFLERYWKMTCLRKSH